ncbi:heat-shock protein Hsp20 [Rhodococcus sp. WMMA185]|uniref:Hsp20/alpha crystallin family protein n=1 Tax=Rhodococcus sp. WMMA185 TaxID=679318 RepID=UPI000878132F|nr:Hsp20/alpha crystallin family protein [Rhodococcus sp. WMMA185]AOW92652.1 heat-shock protein Hsp20 [Rhodococcus sp. WMMA185]
MSTLSPRRPHQSWFSNLPALPDWPDLLPRFEATPPWMSLGRHMIHVEEQIADGRYTLRAELPGVDPAKDIDVSVRDGQLTIKAERTEESQDARSEFRYGSFYRSVPLPAGATDDEIEASYEGGILTVSMPVSESQTAEKHIEIQQAPATEADERTDADRDE